MLIVNTVAASVRLLLAAGCVALPGPLLRKRTETGSAGPGMVHAVLRVTIGRTVRSLGLGCMLPSSKSWISKCAVLALLGHNRHESRQLAAKCTQRKKGRTGPLGTQGQEALVRQVYRKKLVQLASHENRMSKSIHTNVTRAGWCVVLGFIMRHSFQWHKAPRKKAKLNPTPLVTTWLPPTVQLRLFACVILLAFAKIGNEFFSGLR
jgi:hypothetical protein